MDILRSPDQPATDIEAGMVVERSSTTSRTSKSVDHEVVNQTKVYRKSLGKRPRSYEHFSIRQCNCFLDTETKEECRARMARIVDCQKKCYGADGIDINGYSGEGAANPDVARS